MMTTPDSNQPLCPKSTQAIDALVENGFDTQKVDPQLQPRCIFIMNLLSSLRSGPAPCAPVSETIARTRSRIRNAGSKTYTLSEIDSDALELLVSHGWEARRVPSALRERAERQAAHLSLLDSPSPQSSESRQALIAATLARVHAEGAAQTVRMRIHEPAMPRRAFSFRNVAAAAVVLVVGASVTIPTLASVRSKAQQTACIGNFGAIAQALSGYANQSNDALPMAGPSRAGTVWWNVGNPVESNSANLFTLVPTGFAKPTQLACCGNTCAKACNFTSNSRDWQQIDQVSYSFQSLFTSHRTTYHSNNTVPLLADKNPVVRRAARGERVIYVDENSPNHGGRGQNVLFADGSARWTTSPNISETENIWLPRSIERLIAKATGNRNQAEALRGTEQRDEAEAFLVP